MTISQKNIFRESASAYLDSKKANTAIANIDCKLADLERNAFIYSTTNTSIFIRGDQNYSDRSLFAISKGILTKS